MEISKLHLLKCGNPLLEMWNPSGKRRNSKENIPRVQCVENSPLACMNRDILNFHPTHS